MYFWLCVAVIVAGILGTSLYAVAAWRESIPAMSASAGALTIFLCGCVILLWNSEITNNISALEATMSSGNVLSVIGGVALFVFLVSSFFSWDIKTRRDLVAFGGWGGCLLCGGRIVSMICGYM